MWAFLSGVLFGVVFTGAGVVYLLFQWNPRPMLEDALAKRRRTTASLMRGAQREPNAWERQQADAIRRSMPSQPPESCVWINAIAGYAFSFLSERINAAAADGRLEASINEKLNKKQLPDFLAAPIQVSHLSVGSALPVLQCVDVQQCDPAHPLEFSATISYHGSACAVVGTSVCAPGLPFVSLPVELALKNLQLDCTAKISLDMRHLPDVKLALTLAPDVHVGLELHTQLGHQLLLQDLSVLQAAMQLGVQEVLQEELVEPNSKEVEFKLY